MRKTFLLAALLVGCAKAETPVDTSATAVAPAAPANLTAADLAGSWNGVTKAEGSDSVVARWTTRSTTDSTGTLTYEGTKTAIPISMRFDADSTIISSAAFSAPNAKKGAPKVVFSAVGRMQDGRLVGTSRTYVPNQNDATSTVRTFEATKAP